MLTRLFRLAALLLLLIAAPSIASDALLHLYTEEYPPITFSRGGTASGLATEIVEEIMRRLDIAAPIEVVPWARAYKYATTMRQIGLFATTRTAERERLFKWVGPISATTAHFYMRRNGPRFENFEQARMAESILIPREWYLQQILQTMGFSNIHAVPTPTEAVRMLAAGRAPLMALDDVTLADTLIASGVNANELETGFMITQAIQYIAFSRDVSDEIVARWQKTLDDMKTDGSLERLYVKWLPGVKPPGMR